MTRLTFVIVWLTLCAWVVATPFDALAKRKAKGPKKKKKAAAEKVVETPATPSADEATLAPAATDAPTPSDVATSADNPPAVAPATAEPAAAPPAAVAPPASPSAASAAASDSAATPAASSTITATEVKGASPAVASESTAATATSAQTNAELGKPATSAAESPGVFPVTLGLKLGAVVPQIFSNLSPAMAGTVEAAFTLPFLGQRLALYLDFSYCRPDYIVRGEPDPRLLGGEYRYRITEDQYALGVGALARVFAPRSQDLFGLNFYGKLGMRKEFQKASVSGKAMSGLGTTQEVASEASFFVGAGAEFALGPGALVLEIDFDYAGVNHQLSGNAATGGLGFLAGYVVILGSDLFAD
jgi:hypothetical protein